MAKGILGRKIGMTQVFAENGDLIPSNSYRSCAKRSSSKENC